MKKPITPESLYEYSVIESPQFSPDGKTILFVKMQADDASNGYLRSIWEASSTRRFAPRRITFGNDDYCPQWAPDGKRIAFISTRGGSPQAFVLPYGGGEARRLTNMLSGVSNLRWSADSRWIAFNASATAEERDLEDAGLLYTETLAHSAVRWSQRRREELRDPRLIEKLPYRTGTAFFDGCYEHVYIISSEGGVPRRLSHGDFHHAAPEWSIDSKYVYANSNRAQENGEENFELWSSIMRFDVETGEETCLVKEVSEEGREALISPDGTLLAHPFAPKVESPYAEPYHVAVSPNQIGAESRLISNDSQTVISFRWDADSAHLFFLTHERGDGKIIRVSIHDDEVTELISGKQMVDAFDVRKDGGAIAFTASSSAHPGDLYVYFLKSGKTYQLTDFNHEFESTHFFSEPHEINFTSDGNVEIQGWFFRPRNFDPEKTFPLTVEIHGGPQIMWGNSFWHEFQVLCSRGYYVYFCNPRGSAGYGAEFQRIRGKGGNSDMADIMNGLDVVLSMEKSANAEQLCVTGGSYGGFMTAWIVTHTRHFQAAVSQRGVYDELNMFGSGDIPESVEWYFGGIPREETLLDIWEHSPSAHAKNVTTPILIMHSEQDYRCPISQAESFFAYLRRSGNRTAAMMRFPREGHSLSRSGEPYHRMERLYQIVAWFDKHIAYFPFDEAMNGADARKWASQLPGWKISAKKLSYRLPCGNRDIAILMIGEISDLLKLAKRNATLTVENSETLIEIEAVNQGPLTLKELLLAKRLSDRLSLR